MVKLSEDERLDRIFRALADSSRRSVLKQLREQEMTVGQLAEPLEMSLPGVSKHLRVLEECGLVSRRIEGRVHWLRLEAAPLARAMSWIRFYESFWLDSLDALADFVESQQKEEHEQ